MHIPPTELCFSSCRCYAHPAHYVVHYQANLDPGVSDQRVQAERGAFFLDFWTASARVTNRALGVANFCGAPFGISPSSASVGEFWQDLGPHWAAHERRFGRSPQCQFLRASSSRFLPLPSAVGTPCPV